jgi:hypothetical protein
MISGLCSLLSGQVWLALIDLADCVGVPDVYIARDFVQRQIFSSANIPAVASSTLSLPPIAQVNEMITEFSAAFPLVSIT